MNRGIPEKALLSSATSVNNLAIAADGNRIRHQVTEDLRKHAATALAASEKVTEHRGDYATTFRLEVYVLHPDDLHRIIQEEAQTLYMMRPVDAFAVPDVNAELLAALEAAVADCDQIACAPDEMELDWVDEARAAIAKAKAMKS